MFDSLREPVRRRTLLQGLGVGALGLAGAALLGCGTKNSNGGASSNATASAGKGNATATPSAGNGLPITAPITQGKPRQGGTFTQSTTSTYVQHDPDTALATNIWHNIGEKGLEPDPRTGAIRPHVFTSWEVADPSGTTLVFKMAPNLFIHNMPPWNGRQFTADDAAYNLMRIGGLFADQLKIPLSAFQRASMVANITKAEAVDPLTVKVTLSKPNSSFFNGLMDTRVPFMPKEMDEIGFSDPLKMGGIGAFQVTEWVKDQKMTFKKFDKYFRPNEPHFDLNPWIIIPDRAGLVAAFISGQVQMITGLVQSEMDTLQKTTPDAQLYTWVDSNWNHLRPSVEYAPFKDFRVRNALHLATDVAQIDDGLYGPGWAYQAALSPGYPEAWGPDKVKTLPASIPTPRRRTARRPLNCSPPPATPTARESTSTSSSARPALRPPHRKTRHASRAR